jgi:hypothetical protein
VLLTDYAAQVTDLLHDPENQIWTQSQITGYVNQGRDQVATDSWCLRQILTPDAYPTLVFTQGFEFFDPTAFLPSQFGSVLVGVHGITVIINNYRRALKYAPYMWLSANYRKFTNTQSQPIYFSRISPTQMVIEPVPSQSYTCEFDIAVLPTDLTGANGEVDQIPVPFQSPVQYYAAYKAKVNQQQLQEAQLFMGLYNVELRRVAAMHMPAMNPYPAGR